MAGRASVSALAAVFPAKKSITARSTIVAAGGCFSASASAVGSESQKALPEAI